MQENGHDLATAAEGWWQLLASASSPKVLELLDAGARPLEEDEEIMEAPEVLGHGRRDVLAHLQEYLRRLYLHECCSFHCLRQANIGEMLLKSRVEEAAALKMPQLKQILRHKLEAARVTSGKPPEVHRIDNTPFRLSIGGTQH